MSAETESDSTTESQVAETATTSEDGPVEGQEALGDAGKQALDRMKAQRKAAQDAERAARAELDALRAQIAGREQEHALELEKQKAKDDALAAANHRILSAELRAAAKGKLADPTDAGLYIDLASFDVTDDGEVDSDALNSAIDDLLSRKPHLAATAKRFAGTADGGATTATATGPKQLTREDLKSMTSAQIVAAQDAGQFDELMRGK